LEKEFDERYLERFARSGGAVGLEFAGVREILESRARTADARRREEAQKLQDAAQDALLVLLDERGKTLPSQELASSLAGFRDSGTRHLVFAIGGPDGHGGLPERAAGLSLSFGAQTWPHQ